MHRFTSHDLSNGVRLFVNSTPKFRTNLVQVFVHRPLGDDYTKFALLANVLKRGSKRYPETIDLARRWDDLYGAMFNTQVYKLGEQHVLEFKLELANEKYLLENDPLLSDGMETLTEMLATPSLDADQLREEHVSQEKDTLTRAINSLFNDKGTYSNVRCIEEMCAKEPYRRLELGDKDELATITRENLTHFYAAEFPKSQIWVAITGDLEPEEAVSTCERVLSSLRLTSKDVQRPIVDVPVKEVRTVFEEQQVNQGKLVMGFRNYTSCASPDYAAMVMYNGILGAFPHSKLFINVREKASLAYYCTSSLLPVKGLMLIRSGIAFDKYDAALEIIDKQLKELRAGQITEEEMDNTRLALINEVRSDEDNPARQVRTYLERIVAGREYDSESLIQTITQVTREDVVRAAEKVRLDTIYFLRGKE